LARVISTLLVLGLLGGSAAAFAVTEKLKLERSPITGTRMPTAFSPACHCASDSARISFRLRKPDTVSATVLDEDGEMVQTIAEGLHAAKGYVRLKWDGRNQAGAVVPEGGYRVRVHLARRHETITIPNTIQVDVTPPKITLVSIAPKSHVFSPDRDGRRDHIAIKFDVSEVARPLLYVDGKEAIRGRLTHATGVLYWSGRVNARKLPPGSHSLTLRSADVAGNTGPPTAATRVVIRYLALGRKLVHARPGRGFTLTVSSDARRLTWHVGGRSGVAKPGRVSLQAPKRRGRYRVSFAAAGHRAVAHLVVRGKK
jgi:hypothetical protein